MLFISYSSSDKKHALDLQRRLRSVGYVCNQHFLDSDERSGIKLGERWERVLYDNLRECQALLVLCSPNWLQSKWCFAELASAKMSGKQVFPLVLADCDRSSLSEYQAVFIDSPDAARREEAFERLFRDLQDKGLGPRDWLPWPNPKLKDSSGQIDDCPFPGLPAYDERYAAVYFGREREKHELLEELRQMRTNGEPRLLMIIGGSGSGKSSLLMAGLLPALKHPTFHDEWLVLSTLRFAPRMSPNAVFEALADAIVSQSSIDSARQRQVPDRDELVSQFVQDDAATAAKAFVDSVRRLTVSRDASSATTLLPIDQFESLLVTSSAPQAEKFLKFLYHVCQPRDDRCLIVGTMRSDYLDVFERHPQAIKAPSFKEKLLKPFDRAQLPKIIVEPAKRARVEINSELVEQLKLDTPSVDALPILAFTLEKLYRKHRIGEELTLAAYNDLGCMDGLIKSTAEKIFDPGAQPAAVVAAVRMTFVKRLAEVNDKGDFVRLSARWNNIDPLAQPILEQFVTERLLVKTKRDGVIFLEVAHESIFRCWPVLSGWLSTSVDVLRWRRDIRRDQEGAKLSKQVWKGLSSVQFAMAKKWPTTRRSELSDEENGWIKASSRRNALAWTGVLLAATVVLSSAGVAVWFGVLSYYRGNDLASANIQLKLETNLKTRQRDVIRRERDEADSRAADAIRASYGNQVSVAARHIRDGNFAQAQAILNECHPDLRAWEWRYLKHESDQSRLTIDVPSRIVTGALSVTGDRFAAALKDGTILVGSLPDGRELFRLRGHEGDVESVDFSPSGNKLVSGGSDASIRVWDLEDGSCICTMRSTGKSGVLLDTGSPGRVNSVRFSEDGKTIIATGKPREEEPTVEYYEAIFYANSREEGDRVIEEAKGRLPKHGAIEIWDANTGEMLRDVGEEGQIYQDAVILKKENWILGGSWNGSVSIFDKTALAGSKPVRFEKTLCGEIQSIAVSHQSSLIAIAGTGPTIEIRSADSLSLQVSLPNEQDVVLSVAFDGSGTRLLSSGRDGSIRMWDLNSQRLDYQLRGHVRPVSYVCVHPDGQSIFSCGEKLKLWGAAKPTVGGETLDLQLGPIRSITLSPDGTAVASLHSTSHSPHAAAPRSPAEKTSETIIVVTRLADRAELWRRANDGAVKTVAVDGKLAALFEDGQFQIIDFASGSVLHEFKAGERRVFGTALSADGSYIAISYLATKGSAEPTEVDLIDDRRNRLGLIQTSDGTGSAEVQCETHGLTCLAVNADKGWCVAGFDTTSGLIGSKTAKLPVGGALAITNLREMTAFRVYHPEPVRAVSFSSKGDWVAAAGDDATIQVLQTTGFSSLLELSNKARAEHPMGSSELIFSPYYESKVITDALGRRSFVGHRSVVNDVLFIDSDRRVLSASADGTVRVWDIQSGAELLVLSGHQDAVNQLLFDAAGNRLLSCSDDGTIRIWKGAESYINDATDLVTSAIRLMRTREHSNMEEGIRRFSTAIDIYRRAAHEEALPLYHQRLAVALGNRASAYAATSQFEQCNVDDDEAVELAQQLVEGPRGWRYRELLAGLLTGRAGKSARQADGRAEADLDRASAIYEHLVDVEGQTDLQYDLADSHHTKGITLFSKNKLADAIEAYRRAIAILEQGVSDDVEWERKLAIVLHNRAVAYGKLGQKDEGLKDIDRAIRIRQLHVKIGLLGSGDDLSSSKVVRGMLSQ